VGSCGALFHILKSPLPITLIGNISGVHGRKNENIKAREKHGKAAKNKKTGENPYKKIWGVGSGPGLPASGQGSPQGPSGRERPVRGKAVSYLEGELTRGQATSPKMRRLIKNRALKCHMVKKRRANKCYKRLAS
jgi:hypothetical protein